MSTIHDLRARQSGAVQSRFFDADESSADTGQADRATPERHSAEIILFPRASLKSLQRSRKKLIRRRAAAI
jgi:hypothetical protein